MDNQRILEVFEKFYQSLPEGMRLMNGEIASEVKDEILILSFKNNMLAVLFKGQEGERLALALKSAGFNGVSIEFLVRAPQEEEKREKEKTITKSDIAYAAREDIYYKDVRPESTFEEFVTGPSNEVVACACRKLAEGSFSCPYRLLFIEGDTASGKTHLLHAMVNYALSRGIPKKRIVCIDARAFQGEYVRRTNDGSGSVALDAYYQNRYGEAQFFLLDNLHFLTGEKTQRRFSILFDLFEQEKSERILVVTSVARPSQLSYVSTELRSRIEKMASLPIALPDTALMRRIVAHKAERGGIVLSPVACQAIAAFAGQDVRKAEGALTTIKSFGELTGKSGEEAWLQWQNYQEKGSREETAFFEVVDMVAKEFGVPKQDLLQGKRGAATRARKATLWIFSQITRVDAGKLARLSGMQPPKRVADILSDVRGTIARDRSFAEKINTLLDRFATSNQEGHEPKPF